MEIHFLLFIQYDLSSPFFFLKLLRLCGGLVAKSFQSCRTPCQPMDYSLPGSSVHGILQARILECVAMPFSRGSSQPRDWTRVSYVSWTGRRAFFFFFTTSATWEASHEIKRHLLLGRKAMTNLDSTDIKKQIHCFADRGPYSQSQGFSSNHMDVWVGP